jgi:hypothetical protein
MKITKSKLKKIIEEEYTKAQKLVMENKATAIAKGEAVLRAARGLQNVGRDVGKVKGAMKALNAASGPKKIKAAQDTLKKLIQSLQTKVDDAAKAAAPGRQGARFQSASSTAAKGAAAPGAAAKSGHAVIPGAVSGHHGQMLKGMMVPLRGSGSKKFAGMKLVDVAKQGGFPFSYGPKVGGIPMLIIKSPNGKVVYRNVDEFLLAASRKSRLRGKGIVAPPGSKGWWDGMRGIEIASVAALLGLPLGAVLLASYLTPEEQGDSAGGGVTLGDCDPCIQSCPDPDNPNQALPCPDDEGPPISGMKDCPDGTRIRFDRSCSGGRRGGSVGGECENGPEGTDYGARDWSPSKRRSRAGDEEYETFYRDLERGEGGACQDNYCFENWPDNLLSHLGRQGKDYKWGPKHRKAYCEMLGVIEELKAAAPEEAGAEEEAESVDAAAARKREEADRKKAAERRRKEVALIDAKRLYQLAEDHTDAEEERRFTVLVRKHLDGNNIDNLYEMYSQVLFEKGEQEDRGDLVQELFHEDLDELGYEVLRRINALPGGKEKLSMAQDSAGKIPAKGAAVLRPGLKDARWAGPAGYDVEPRGARGGVTPLREGKKHWPKGAPRWNNYNFKE